MNDVNHASDKTVHLLKTLLLARAFAAFCFLRPAFDIIKELHINGSQQFSVLQSHYIYREGMESNKKKLIGGMR